MKERGKKKSEAIIKSIMYVYFIPINSYLRILYFYTLHQYDRKYMCTCTGDCRGTHNIKPTIFMFENRCKLQIPEFRIYSIN